MAGAAEMIVLRKLGPRVLSFLPNSGGVLSNCRKSLSSAQAPFVLGEDGTSASVALLVHGTYILRVIAFPGAAIYLVGAQQLNPRDAGAANPLNFGHPLHSGESFEFFVDDSLIDGVIAVEQCGQAPEFSCGQNGGPLYPIVTVNRIISVLPMAATGDTASANQLRPIPADPSVCGGR